MMWMQCATCFWLALCAGWLKLDVLVHALKQMCWYYVEVPCCCLVLWWHMRDIRSKCFTSLGICKWYHWHSSGIWPKRTQDWQVQVWVKELDGTWVWSHSRSREAACKYHAMAMWSGCMMQVKVSAVAMLLTLFCDDWRELSSCAVLCCVGSQGIESSSFGIDFVLHCDEAVLWTSWVVGHCMLQVENHQYRQSRKNGRLVDQVTAIWIGRMKRDSYGVSCTIWLKSAWCVFEVWWSLGLRLGNVCGMYHTKWVNWYMKYRDTVWVE